MAHVTKETIGLLNEKITVTVDKEDYLPSFEKAVKSYSQKANIPGFRKGMVPSGMVKKMYGTTFFADEVIKSVEKNLQDYMVNEKLEIFAQPLPLPDSDVSKLDMNHPAEYAFSFEIGLKPGFALPDFGSMNLTRYKIEVTDQMVTEEVDRVRKENRHLEEGETVPAEDFELSVSLKEIDAEGNEPESATDKQEYFYSTDLTPAFKEQLAGKRKDDTIDFDPATALEDKAREAFNGQAPAGEEGQPAGQRFRMTLGRINLSKPAELNEEFFKKAFPAQEILTEGEFRDQVRKQLETELDAPVRNQLHDQVFHQLQDHTRIDFPESFLKRWMQTNEEKPKTAEEVEQEYPGFIKNLQWTLIMDKVMQEQNIHVHKEDLEAAAKQQLFSYFRGSMDMDMEQPWVNDYVQRMMKDKRFVEDTGRRLEVEKVFNWIDTQVHPAETPISMDDFTKLQEQHQH